MPNLVLFGIQGSGKGTQANLLAKKHHFTHLNIGSLLRNEMKMQTEIGKKVEYYMHRGDLVPDKYIFTLIEPILRSQNTGLVLDGIPRTLQQASFLENLIPVKYAIYFELDVHIAKERLNHRRVCQHCQTNYNLLLNNEPPQNICNKCGHPLELRDDDNKEAIARRINAFQAETKPVVDYFRNRKKLITIKADEKPELIHKEIVDLLDLPLKETAI